jgi:hypothetical protein
MSHLIANRPVARSPAIGENHQGKPQQAETAKEVRRFWIPALLRHHIPTLTVMAVLVGLGIYGHRSDWKLPKFSALTVSFEIVGKQIPIYNDLRVAVEELQTEIETEAEIEEIEV